MSNTIKYSTQTENNTLKKGDFVIGVNNVDYGPTSETGYHNTITPPEGGYVVYKNRGDNERSIYVAESDEELVLLKDDFGATGSTANDVLVWAAQQDDIIILNNPLDNIVTDGLVLYLDAGSICSYPKTNTKLYDLSGNGNDGTLINSPVYSGDNQGTITFDSTDEYVNIPHNSSLNMNDNISVEMWFYSKSYQNPSLYASNIFRKYGNTTDANFNFYYAGRYLTNKLRVLGNANGVWRGVSPTSQVLDLNKWYHVVWTYSNGGLLYINGLSQGTKEASGLLATNNKNVDFGIGLDGNISNVKMYNKSLSETEVLQNYNAQKSRFGIGWASATEILEYNPDATSGYYNIQPLGTSTSVSVYCDMETDGGGWMHVGTISDNNENSNNATDHPWGYPLDPTQDTGIWEDTTTLNEETPSFTGDYKNRIWYTAPFTQILIKDQGNTQRNLLYTNDGQITSNNSSLSDWFGSLSWGAIGSDRSSNAYNNNRVTALDITNFGINDAVLESGNKTKLLFKFGEFDGAQDGNKDRTMIAWHRYNFTDNVDSPAGLGNFTNRNGNIDYRDIQPYAQRSDWPDANITGGPYNYSIWVR